MVEFFIRIRIMNDYKLFYSKKHLIAAKKKKGESKWVYHSSIRSSNEKTCIGSNFTSPKRLDIPIFPQKIPKQGVVVPRDQRRPKRAEK